MREFLVNKAVVYESGHIETSQIWCPVVGNLVEGKLCRNSRDIEDGRACGLGKKQR
jgi:hypothetical protein